MTPEKTLSDAIAAIADRGRQRDTSTDGTHKERSMARSVAAFNAIEGTNLTERQGWAFMQILKMARAGATARNGKANVDDYVDGAAYAALACEAAVEATLNRQADREEEHYHRVFAGIRAAAATQSAEPAPEAAA